MPVTTVSTPGDVAHRRTLRALDGLPLFVVGPAGEGERGPGEAAASAAADDAPASPVGSSSCHNGPRVHLRSATVRVALGGNVVRLRGPELSGDAARAKSARQRETPRGTIKEFSRASRRRLLARLQEVDQRRLLYRPLMVTLTYPGDWPASPEVWKSHLRAFTKRLRRRYPDAAIIWRLEAQERGAPHYHLLIFGVRYLPFQWVGDAWATITDGNAAACARVERVRSWRGVVSYASKYLAKLDGRAFRAGVAGDELVEVGRLWGVVNAAGLPADVREWALTMGQFFNLRRLLYRCLNASRRAAGKTGRRRPRDATAGLTTFLGWYSGVQLVQLGGSDVDITALAVESVRIEEETRFMRRLRAEVERGAGDRG